MLRMTGLQISSRQKRDLSLSATTCTRNHSQMTSKFQIGRQVGQVASDFTKVAFVVKYLIRVGRQVKNTQKPSDVICECSPRICFILQLFTNATYYLHIHATHFLGVKFLNIACPVQSDHLWQLPYQSSNNPLFLTSHKGSFNNYVDQNLTNFDALPPRVDKRWTKTWKFTYPPPLSTWTKVPPP